MKSKTIVTFESENRKFWSKETGERRKTDYILLARLPEQENFLFASTMESSMIERYGKNVQNDLEGIALLKEKGGRKYLDVIWNNGEKIRLETEQFVLLFIAPNNDNTDNDNMLLFHFPSLLGEKIYKRYLDSDKDCGAAVAIFWMLKEFF